MRENQAESGKCYKFTFYLSSHKLMSMMNKHLCAFIEFEQAFDIVWRNGLLSKLINNGVNEK